MGVPLQNNLLDLCVRIVNSQRLLYDRRTCIKCWFESSLVYKKIMKNIKIASMGVLSRCHQKVYNHNKINNNNIPLLKVSSFLSLMDRK